MGSTVTAGALFEDASTAKEMMMLRTLLVRIGVGSAVLFVASVPGHAQTGHATLEGYQEVPAVSTSGSGSFRAKIDKDAGTIYWELNYSDLESDALQSHIHFGQHGVNGGVGVFLCTNLGNGPAGTPTCPLRAASLNGMIMAANVIGPAGQGLAAGEFDELVAAIRRGVAYVNVHSATWPGGEIRGQIK